MIHVIWTERQMLKLVLNVKYLLLLSFLTAAESEPLIKIYIRRAPKTEVHHNKMTLPFVCFNLKLKSNSRYI